VNQLLFDGLTVLQHRGQDAAGMVTSESAGSASNNNRLHLRKDNGLVKDVFQLHHMLELRGHVGIGHCRYPTAGTSSCAEAQPLYTNYPYGICVAHNGNITNTDELSKNLRDEVGRHINTDSDSELLLNLFAEALTKETRLHNDEAASANMTDAVFAAMKSVMNSCKGGYAGLFLINGVGLVGFRDPHGIRPLVFGCRKRSLHPSPSSSSLGADSCVSESSVPGTPAAMDHAERQLDYAFASESVALDTLGFHLVRYVILDVADSRRRIALAHTRMCSFPSCTSDVRAGEAIFIDTDGNCHRRVVHNNSKLSPCIFEYVYFARPDSIMDGVSVYESRLNMGTKLAENILKKYPNHEIDVVIPIPDTSRTAALQAAYRLDRPFREGFIKNRYIARTFIMPGQATRRKSVRLKLNTIKSEFQGKNVLLVDDSIVRGTTANEIVQMARDAGARKVFFCSAAPPIRFPNIYGIDIPTRQELIAYGRTEDAIAREIGCDWVVYQDLKDLERSVLECKNLQGQHYHPPVDLNGGNSEHQASPPQQPNRPALEQFDTSCFSGQYVTGERIGDDYFAKLHDLRNDQAKEKRKFVVTNPDSDGTTTAGDDALAPPSSNVGTDNTGGDSAPSPPKKHMASNDGCESVSNDKRQSLNGGGVAGGCETLTNKQNSAMGVVR
jgi:amidophosphoribosyltransferase